MPSRHFATGFAEGFTGAALQVLPYFLQRKSERERLELEKKALTLRERMAKSQDELHQLQMQQMTEKLGAGRKLESLLQGGGPQGPIEPGQEAGIEMGVEPERAPVSPEQRGAFRQRLISGLARLDPTGAAKLALAPEPQDPAAMSAILRQLFGGQGVGIEGPGPEAGSAGRAVPGIPPGMPPGGAGMPSGGVIVQPPGQEAGAVGRAVPGPPGPGMTLEPSVSFDKQGRMSVTVKGQRVQLQVKDFPLESPPGSGQNVMFRQLINPVSGQASNPVQIGPAATGEARRNAADAAVALGAPKGSPLNTSVAEQLLLIDRIADPDKKDRLTQDLRERIAQSQGAAPGGPIAPLAPPDIGAARSRAQKEKLEQIRAETIEREKAQREQAPVAGADRAKYESYLSIERQIGVIKDLYKPQFVGKGWFDRDYKEALTEQEALAREGKYNPGAIAGSVRLFFGKASPEEVQFRKSVLDITDMMLRARSGAQINEQEYQRLKRFMVSLYDAPATFRPGLDRLHTEVGAEITDVLKTATMPASQLLKERQQKQKTAPPPPAAKLQTFLEAMIVQDAAGKRYRLERGEKLPEGWRVLGPYPTGGR